MIPWKPFLLALGTIVLAAGLTHGLARTQAVPEQQPLRRFPINLEGWTGRTAFFTPDVVAGLHADDYLLRSYQDAGGRALWLFVAYYRAQVADESRIHAPTVCLPGAGWTIVDAATMPVSVRDRTITVNRTVVQKGDRRDLVLYWYQLQGRVAATELQAMSLLAWTSLAQRRSDEALVRINGPVSGTVQGVLESEVAFVRAAFPLLSRILPQ